MPTPGIVVSIRVNPQDVMGVIDTIDHIGIAKDNLSFSQATKIVLASALESFRQSGIIPRRQGFEYLQMIEPFERQNFSSRGAKLKSAAALRQPDTHIEPVIPETYEHKQRRLRYEELMIKRNSAPDSWSEEDQQEFVPLLEEFYS